MRERRGQGERGGRGGGTRTRSVEWGEREREREREKERSSTYEVYNIVRTIEQERNGRGRDEGGRTYCG